MAFLALGHQMDTYDEFRYTKTKWYSSQSGANKWPTFIENSSFTDTPYVMQVPGTNGSAASLVFTKDTTEFWVHVSCKGDNTYYTGDEKYTQRLWTLKSSNDTPVIWCEMDSDTHAVRLCTISNSVAFNIPTTTACVFDLKIAYNDFRLYVNNVQVTIQNMVFTTPIGKVVFGDDTSRQGIKWYYEYFLVAESALFNYTVKTELPILYSDSVNDGAHGTYVKFVPPYEIPTLDGDVYLANDADQSFEFEPKTEKGDITGVQLNAVMYKGTGKTCQFIRSVFSNVYELTDAKEMDGLTSNVDMFRHIMPAGTRIDVPTDNYGVRVRKIV